MTASVGEHAGEPIALHAAHAFVLRGARLRAVSMGNVPNGSVRALAAHRDSRASYSITTAARFDPNLGDQGPGAAYNAGAKFYSVYRVPIDAAARSAHLAHRVRSNPHRRRRSEHVAAGEALQNAVAQGATRLTGNGRDRHAYRPQPARDRGTRRAGGARRVPRIEGRRRAARSELPRVPPVRQSRFAPPRSQRNSNRRDGVRARHRRTRRRGALPVQRLPARQFRRASRSTNSRNATRWRRRSRCSSLQPLRAPPRSPRKRGAPTRAGKTII